MSESLNDLLALLARSAEVGYIGEPVSQLAHALQCAELAATRGGSNALIAASLLHDIGHLCAADDAATMDDLGVVNHETIGGDAADRAGLLADVGQLIAGHVAAKRYLVARSESYRRTLSSASLGTLAFQGGPMDPDEVVAFESHRLAEEMLRLRAWDEEAKVPERDVPALDSYRTLLESLQSC